MYFEIGNIRFSTCIYFLLFDQIKMIKYNYAADKNYDYKESDNVDKERESSNRVSSFCFPVGFLDSEKNLLWNCRPRV